MIRHIVFFKFHPEVTEQQRASALAELKALPAKIPVIREFEIGEDVVHSPRSWSCALVSIFDDLQALNEYQVHGDHVAAARGLRDLCESVASVDYEF